MTSHTRHANARHSRVAFAIGLAHAVAALLAGVLVVAGGVLVHPSPSSYSVPAVATVPAECLAPSPMGAPVDVSGVVLLGARFFDPGAGMFLSVDPELSAGVPAQFNAYVYAGNNPVTWSDPSGRSWFDDAWKNVSGFVKKYKAEITGFAVGAFVTAGCLTLTAGAGSVGCFVAGGMAGGAVTNLIRQSESKKPFNWGSFGTDVAIGGLFGLAGAAGPAAAAVGKFLKPAAAAIGKFLPAAGKYIASAARSSSTGAQTVAKSAKAATTGSSGIRMGGQSTYGGVDKATQNMLKFSERNPQAGYYDVIGHGSPTSLAGMSVDELAIKIGSRSGGQHVRLLSCQTGCPTGTFAQDLADRLGVRVMAPTTDIGSSGSGKTLTIFDGGEWRWFDPN